MKLDKYLDWYRVDRGYWFAPKMFGWGATPVTWQGWLLTIAGVALVVTDIRYVHVAPLRWGIAVLLLAGFTAISALKTEGGWRWRWGPDR